MKLRSERCNLRGFFLDRLFLRKFFEATNLVALMTTLLALIYEVLEELTSAITMKLDLDEPLEDTLQEVPTPVTALSEKLAVDVSSVAFAKPVADLFFLLLTHGGVVVSELKDETAKVGQEPAVMHSVPVEG